MEGLSLYPKEGRAGTKGAAAAGQVPTVQRQRQRQRRSQCRHCQP